MVKETVKKKQKSNQLNKKIDLQTTGLTRDLNQKYTKNSHNSTTKNQTIQLKDGQVPKQTLLSRRHKYAQYIYLFIYIHKKMLNITSY